jgi:branched-chain amino acid transport system permease protein
VLNLILVPGLVMGMLYTLVALGINVLVRVTGVVNFAFGDLLAWGPLAVLVGTNIIHVSLVIALVGAGLFVIVLALIEERLAIRPFMGSHVALPWILSTLAVSLILEQVAGQPFHGQTEAFPYNFGQGELSIGPLQTSPVDVTIVCVSLGLYLGMSAFWTRTSTGKMLAAVSEDSKGAAAVGISSRRASQVAAGLAALVAFSAGIVAAPVLQIYPDLGLGLLFSGFVAAAMGGLGSLGGSLPGGLLVGLISQLITVYVGPSWLDLFLFAGLLVIYLRRPFGLFGRPIVRAV